MVLVVGRRVRRAGHEVTAVGVTQRWLELGSAVKACRHHIMVNQHLKTAIAMIIIMIITMMMMTRKRHAPYRVTHSLKLERAEEAVVDGAVVAF